MPSQDEIQGQQLIDDVTQTDAIDADFLNRLAGIGTVAYLDMLQADTPEYEDWRDGNFVSDDSGDYVSEEGQSYAEDQLQRIHGVLSRQAGDPLLSRLFDRPKWPPADDMTWNNQKSDNLTVGAWDEDRDF